MKLQKSIHLGNNKYPEDFFGKITTIGGEAELDNRSDITIKLATIGDEGKKITVQVQLPFAAYYSTVDEAVENANAVKVCGLLTIYK